MAGGQIAVDRIPSGTMSKRLPARMMIELKWNVSVEGAICWVLRQGLSLDAEALWRKDPSGRHQLR